MRSSAETQNFASLHLTSNKKINATNPSFFVSLPRCFVARRGNGILLKRKRVSLVRLGEPGQFTEVSTDTRNQACLLSIYANKVGLVLQYLTNRESRPYRVETVE